MAKIKYKNSEGEWKEAGGKTSLSWNDITDKPDLTGIPSRTEILNQLSFKVDKVDGKQLSTEDFTTALKEKLDGLSNYDDTTISEAVEKLRTDFDTLVSGDASTAIDSFNEIIAFLDGIEDSESLDSIIASIDQQIAAKYTKPSTGIPKSDLASDVQTSLGKADTALQSYTEKYTGTITGITMNGASKGTSGVVDLGTVITAHQDISGKLDSSTAASTYLSKTDAASTYLGKTAKAASATTADSATKATQDASGNVITSTYATKSEIANMITGDGTVLQIVKVSALPSSPVSTTLYVIPE